jgi:hypothetical protein
VAGRHKRDFLVKPSEQSTNAEAKNPEARCEECGCYGAMEVAGRVLCEDCYSLCGACCTEFTPEQNPSQPSSGKPATDEKQSRCL